jgi:hypothetical protein
LTGSGRLEAKSAQGADTNFVSRNNRKDADYHNGRPEGTIDEFSDAAKVTSRQHHPLFA